MPGELRQVFSNLLANSLDAIEEQRHYQATHIQIDLPTNGEPELELPSPIMARALMRSHCLGSSSRSSPRKKQPAQVLAFG